MRRPLILLGVGMACMLLIAGCSSSSSENNEVAELVQVEIKTIPDKLQPGQPVQIEAHVTQDIRLVDDAQEVKFEIWKKDQDEHENIEATHLHGGIYRVNRTFPETGIYYVIAHVTARDMHVMPQKELIIGEGNYE